MANRICIVGTGYVGMATMLGLAELGWAVNGFDIVGDRIARLRAGVAPYREAGIEELLAKHAAAGRLEFFDDVGAATEDCDVIVVAVGTPARDDGSADLSALHTAFGMLTGMAFRRYPSIVVRSTVPPGTCDELAAICVGRANVVYVPEFLREGTAVRDFLTPDRIVVGAASFEAAALYVELFERLQCPVLLTSRSNAELIKCGSNAFLALKISFANEVANLCEAVGATSDDVLRGIGYDRRIGSEFLNPGIGFGGPCFEKDVKSLDHVAKAAGSGRELFAATLRVNESQPKKIVDILERELGSLAGRTIGVWGLAFKAGTDDVRDSLALRILDDLAAREAIVLAFDPMVHVAPLPPQTRLMASAEDALDADALLILTEWPGFRDISPHVMARALRERLVVDGRNVLDAQRVAAAGLRYRGVGRPQPGAVDWVFARSAV